MRCIRTASGRPSAARTLAALAVFLLGSNYCLVGALAGSLAREPLACHSTVVDVPASSCCHAPGAAEQDGPPPAAERSMPCCMQLAPPSVVQIDKSVTDGHPLLQALPAAPETSAPNAGWIELHRLDDPSPPASLARAPHGSRAPPLS